MDKIETKQNTGDSLDLVNIKEIKDGVIIINDGSMHQVIMVGGVNFALKSEAEQNIIIQTYQNFVNGISFPLQIIIHSRKVNIEAYIENLKKREAEETSSILKNQIEEYINFIQGFVLKNAIMEKIFFIAVPFYPTSIVPKSASASVFSFLGKKNNKEEIDKNTQNEENIFKNNLVQLNERTNQVLEGITSVGLDAEILTNDQLVELFYNFYNPQTIERKMAKSK
jgi:type IV secretory pathway VirB4 component